jgi:hypothetical protein
MPRGTTNPKQVIKMKTKPKMVKLPKPNSEEEWKAKSDFDKIKELRAMESLNNKFTDVCIRILNKKGYKQQKRSMQMYELIKEIQQNEY